MGSNQGIGIVVSLKRATFTSPPLRAASRRITPSTYASHSWLSESDPLFLAYYGCDWTKKAPGSSLAFPGASIRQAYLVAESHNRREI